MRCLVILWGLENSVASMSYEFALKVIIMHKTYFFFKTYELLSLMIYEVLIIWFCGFIFICQIDKGLQF